MMSRRQAILSLSMVVLMLAFPWTAVADSSGRGSEEESEKIKITTHKQVSENRIAIEVEFENLTEYFTYEYEINITRVDPDFIHESFSDTFTTEAGETEHTLSEYWTPDQEGPYTVTSTLTQYGIRLTTATGTFGWGDVDSNSQLPNAEITPTPELTHYDLFGNSSLAEDVAIELDAVGTEVGASYKIKWKLYAGDVVDDGASLIGTTENTQHRNFVMDNFLDYFENNSNYTLATWLLRVDPADGGGSTENEVGHEHWSFAIGEAPVITIEPVIPGCTDENATNYESEATEDDGTCVFLDSDGDGVFDHLEIDGCTDENATNYDEDATEEDGTCIFLDSDGDGVFDHLEIEGCTDEDALNFEDAATDDDGTCVYPDPLRVVLENNVTTGDAPLSVAFFANISDGTTPYVINWQFDDGASSEQVQVEHTFTTAGEYTVLLQVTDNGGWADMIERSVNIVVTEPPVIPDLSGYISHTGQLDPVNKSMVASVEFTGTANGGEGPYTFTWVFGDDTKENGSLVLHEYARAGNYTVQLRIEDSAGRTLLLEENITITEVAAVDESDEINATQDGVDGDGTNFDIYATSTGVIGLLLMFGLFGRKRRESFLDAERQKLYGGDGSIWDER